MLRSVDYFLLVLSLQLDSQLIGVSELTLRLVPVSQCKINTLNQRRWHSSPGFKP